MCATRMKITLKKATTKDAEMILELMGDYYSYEGLKFNRVNSLKTLTELLSSEDYGIVDLILVDGHLVGYVCITYGYSIEYLGRDCVLDEIYIVPQYQGKGIGAYVLKSIEKQLNEKGFKTIHLEVFDRNEYARDFFVKHGFIVHKSYFMSKMLCKNDVG